MGNSFGLLVEVADALSVGRCFSAFSTCTPSHAPKRLPEIEYPAHYEVRYVSANGGIRWKCAWVCVTHTLAGEYVGLNEVGDGLWDVYLGPVLLGRMDERKLRIEDHRGRWIRRKVLPMSPD